MPKNCGFCSTLGQYIGRRGNALRELKCEEDRSDLCFNTKGTESTAQCSHFEEFNIYLKVQ